MWWDDVTPVEFRGFDEAAAASGAPHAFTTAEGGNATVAARVTTALKPATSASQHGGGGGSASPLAPADAPMAAPSTPGAMQASPFAVGSRPQSGKYTVQLLTTVGCSSGPHRAQSTTAVLPIRLSVKLSPEGEVLADPDACLCAGMPLVPCTDVECGCGAWSGLFITGRKTYHDSLALLYGELTFEEAAWVCGVALPFSFFIFCLPALNFVRRPLPPHTPCLCSPSPRRPCSANRHYTRRPCEA